MDRAGTRKMLRGRLAETGSRLGSSPGQAPGGPVKGRLQHRVYGGRIPSDHVRIESSRGHRALQSPRRSLARRDPPSSADCSSRESNGELRGPRPACSPPVDTATIRPFRPRHSPRSRYFSPGEHGRWLAGRTRLLVTRCVSKSDGAHVRPSWPQVTHCETGGPQIGSGGPASLLLTSCETR